METTKKTIRLLTILLAVVYTVIALLLFGVAWYLVPFKMMMLGWGFVLLFLFAAVYVATDSTVEWFVVNNMVTLGPGVFLHIKDDAPRLMGYFSEPHLLWKSDWLARMTTGKSPCVICVPAYGHFSVREGNHVVWVTVPEDADILYRVNRRYPTQASFQVAVETYVSENGPRLAEREGGGTTDLGLQEFLPEGVMVEVTTD